MRNDQYSIGVVQYFLRLNIDILNIAHSLIHLFHKY